jgi:hypothetical protein
LERFFLIAVFVLPPPSGWSVAVAYLINERDYGRQAVLEGMFAKTN